MHSTISRLTGVLITAFLLVMLPGGKAFADQLTLTAGTGESADDLPRFGNSVWEELAVDADYYQNPYRVSLFTSANGEDAERLWSQTKSIVLYGLGTAGVLALMPEELTSWQKSDESLAQKWLDHVTTMPVWDNDDLWLNYIGHPYFGGVFYITARKAGYRQWDSFIYSFLLSTFSWEYGLEAFAEVPSLQDLVVTPVLGWVYGEWAFVTERKIWANGGTVGGSEYLGNIVLFLLDPVDSIGRNINALLGLDLIKAGTGYVSVQEGGDKESDRQLIFTVKYLFGQDAAERRISRKRRIAEREMVQTRDPVDQGIVGLGMGGGYARFDGKRGIDGDFFQEFFLGLSFSPRFSVRFYYQYLDAEQKRSLQKIGYEKYGIESEFFLSPTAKVRPFFSLGIGEVIWETEVRDKEFQVNGTVGFHCKVNDNWSLQVAAGSTYGTETRRRDFQFGPRIVYRFGAGEVIK
ncbi:MAG: DUF3943 domain-containing protein [Desulforhopalus sp.]|nr:DUF3943 domain-containing protein [Desulforhopalus sp.]